MIDTTLKSMETIEGTLDTNKVTALNDIMKYCSDHEISLFLIQYLFSILLSLRKILIWLNKLPERIILYFGAF